MSRLRYLLSPLIFAPLLSSAHAAGLGETCAVAADCDKGLACDTIGGTACACPAGEECDCPAEPTEVKACMPAPCTSNDDCGTDLICISFEVPCATPAMDCAPGSECPPPPECTPTTQSACGPRWALPCEEAADCGEGFNCEPVEVCECTGGSSDPGSPTDPNSPPTPDGGDSGSSGSGSSGSGDAPPPEDNCTCQPSDEKACRMIDVACQDDSGCPEGWSCVMVAVTAPACPEGQSCDAMPPANTSGTCAPQGWGLSASSEDSSGGVDLSNGSAETATPTASTPTDDVATSGGGCQGGGLSLFGGWALGVLTLLRRRR